MRLLLPIILVILGAVLVMPLIRIAALMVNSGTPDATAISTDIGSLIQGGLGILLVLAGLVMFIIRLSRHNTVRSS